MIKAMTEFIDWPDLNLLTLNYTKTNYILFSRISSIENNLELITNGNQMKRLKVTKYLGFRFDENLSGKTHLNFIAFKLSRSLGGLHRVKNLVALLIAFALIDENLSLCCSFIVASKLSRSLGVLPELITLVSQKILRLFYFAIF